jgi:hypothetical protein
MNNEYIFLHLVVVDDISHCAFLLIAFFLKFLVILHTQQYLKFINSSKENSQRIKNLKEVV